MTPPIRIKVAKRLARRSHTSTELAEAVGCRFGEAVRQIAVLREIGDEGLGPRVLQDADGRYLIDPDEAAAWKSPLHEPPGATKPGCARPRRLKNLQMRRGVVA